MTAAAPPEIAVVVISFGPRATLVDAVRSVLAQDVPQEVVVVHSGPGDPRPALAAAGFDVAVIRSETPLLVGGARNAGIAHTSAPIVAFLADDCTAGAGWSRERIAAHQAGADAVASCLVSHRPTHTTSLAVHMSLFMRRMPGMPEEEALRYGVSYRRSLLERYGGFREDMRIGEDTEFNSRLHAASPILWTPAVVTAHHGHERLLPALVDQYQRGRRRNRYEQDRGGTVRPSVRRTVRPQLRFMNQFGESAVGPELVRIYRRGRPLIVACMVAYALGRRWERSRP